MNLSGTTYKTLYTVERTDVEIINDNTVFPGLQPHGAILFQPLRKEWGGICEGAVFKDGVALFQPRSFLRNIEF